MTEQETNLAYQKERDDMYYRERAVEHALELNKQQLKQQSSVEELVNNANAIYCFYKGNSK